MLTVAPTIDIEVVSWEESQSESYPDSFDSASDDDILKHLLSQEDEVLMKQRLTFLRAGMQMTKYGYHNSNRDLKHVRISQDYKTLLWNSLKSNRKTETSLPLTDVISVLFGTKSRTFQELVEKDHVFSLKVPEWTCFSIVTVDRTLDFSCEDEDIVLNFILGLQDILPRPYMRYARGELLGKRGWMKVSFAAASQGMSTTRFICLRIVEYGNKVSKERQRLKRSLFSRCKSVQQARTKRLRNEARKEKKRQSSMRRKSISPAASGRLLPEITITELINRLKARLVSMDADDRALGHVQSIENGLMGIEEKNQEKEVVESLKHEPQDLLEFEDGAAILEETGFGELHRYVQGLVDNITIHHTLSNEFMQVYERMLPKWNMISKCIYIDSDLAEIPECNHVLEELDNVLRQAHADLMLRPGNESAAYKMENMIVQLMVYIVDLAKKLENSQKESRRISSSNSVSLADDDKFDESEYVDFHSDSFSIVEGIEPEDDNADLNEKVESNDTMEEFVFIARESEMKSKEIDPEASKLIEDFRENDDKPNEELNPQEDADFQDQ